MKLFKFTIKTYYFGIVHYPMLVLADSKESARKLVIETPKFHNDEDAEIINVEEIDLADTTNRIILE